MKLKLYIIILVGLIISGCNNAEKADYEFFIQDQFVIPSGLNNIETHVFVLKDVRPFLEANLLSKGNSIDDVTSINPGRAELQTRFGGVSLNFIREVSVRGRLSEDKNDYIELFKLNDVSINENSNIALLNTLQDITELMKMETIDIEIRIKLRTFSPQNVPVNIDFSYAVFVDG